MKNNYQILLFYKYINIEDPEELMKDQRKLCQELDLKGRVIIASEGINGTLEGQAPDTEKYVSYMKNDDRFKDVHFKISEGTGEAFPKLSVKVRDEIVSGHFGEKDVDPTKVTGKYLTPEQLHEWIHSDKEFYIIDMRNDYEHAVGYFKDSVLPALTNYRDLPKVLPELENLKGKTVVTVCTGGVRCEKASGFLIENGFSDVYQLYGGIVSYMEKYPNEDFLGKLYVFDNRFTMGFNTESSEHVVVGRCVTCGTAADIYYDCKNQACKNKRHFISCLICIENQQGYCKDCYPMKTSL